MNSDGISAVVDNMKNNCFFTICSKNFMAYARTLYFSLKDQYPDLVFYVALCDDLAGLDEQPFKIIELSELGIPDFEGMANRYNITELNTAIKPFVFEYLFKSGDYKAIAYLDPDILVVSRLVELDNALEDGAEVVLTPHILQPAEGMEMHDQRILQFGIYNLGFVAFRNTPEVRVIIAWWGRRLERDCVIKLDEGLFVDQKWADLLPAFIKQAVILHHPGYNVAYWNLPQRRVTQRNGQWFSNDQPLRFVHFSGNKIDDPRTFSRHSQQVTVEGIGDLRNLLDYYREQIFSQGHNSYRSLPYAFSWNGEAGINLHTPASLDMSNPNGAQQQPKASVVQQLDQNRPIAKMRARMDVLASALPLARRLSGGWAPLVRRTWRAYQRNGWAYVKAKGLELSSFRAPPDVPISSPVTTGTTSASAGRLLYLDWAIPKPNQDAASVTAVLLMRIFRSIGYAVTFVPCGLKYEEGYYEALQSDGIEVLCYPHVDSIEAWLSANAADFDVCFMARGPVVWPYLSILRQVAPSTHLLFNTVDLHYLREMREVELSGSDKGLKAAMLTRKKELDLIRQCDLTILLSNEELYTVRSEVPEAPLAILPIVFEDIPGAGKPFEGRRDILFIGGFLHQPNIDAVVYFAESILPLIQKRLPDIRFKVVGANPPEHIQRLAENPNIDVLGFVKDLDPLFEDIRITVAPLRYGAGIKGKIGSSLCYGIPCIATPIAIEGMGLVDGRDVLVGDTPEAFSEAVYRVYTNDALWQHISNHGYQFALENYSFDIIRERVQNLLWAVRRGWHAIESAYVINSWNAWQQHCNRMETEYAERMLREQALLPTDDTGSFHTPGFCCVCGKETSFLTSFMYSCGQTPDGRAMPNWREHMECRHCGLVNRMRAALNALHTFASPKLNDRIYVTEQVTSMYRWLQSHYENVQGSEYLGVEYEPGALVDGIYHEDIMNLSFDNNTFDRVLSFDVLEHVPDPSSALREIYRVLEKDGVFLFTVPFASDSLVDVVRATLNEDSSIEHHLEPEYHGNPVDPDGGALCFRYFGWELLDQLRAIGFKQVRTIAYWSEKQGYLGKEQYLFIARKSSAFIRSSSVEGSGDAEVTS